MKTQETNPARKGTNKIKKIGRIILWAFGSLILVSALSFLWLFHDLPRPEKFTEGVISQSTKILDRTGKIILYEIAGQEKRTIVPLKQIPDHLQKAVITAEDQNFYQHKGIDPKAILRAFVYDLKMGTMAQGGSTISQQLVKFYLLTQKKTITRKTREILLAIETERRYTKDEILELYLNLIPFGSNLYGVQSASRAFFGKDVQDITPAESAILASMIRSPSRLSPYGSHTQELFNLKNAILDGMVKEGYLTKEEAATAKTQKIVFTKATNESLRAPHFVMLVKSYLEKKYGKSYLEKAGLQVITTLDVKLQEKAEEIVLARITEAKTSQANNGALVATDPKTGELLVMVGSKDFFSPSYPDGCSSGKDCLFDPEVNIATSLRQPGSAFKPFAYATAFEKGFTPSSVIWDVKTEYNPNCSPLADQEKDQYGLDCYNPQNYDKQFKGLISLRSAIAQSRNVPSIKVLYLAGIKNTLDTAKEMGITSLTDENRYGLSLVLGGGEVKLLEITSAYGVFANDGVKAPLNFIKEIKDSNGKTIEKNKKTSERVLPAQIAREINDVLSDNQARAPIFGWDSPLYIENYQVAVKTGTTDNLRDGWAIGYTPGISAGVWVGNNNNAPTATPGVSLAGKIWNDFILSALPNLPQENFIAQDIETPDKIMINGQAPTEPHSILYYVDKDDPLGEQPSDPSSDPQFSNWEYGVKAYNGLPTTPNISN